MHDTVWLDLQPLPVWGDPPFTVQQTTESGFFFPSPEPTRNVIHGSDSVESARREISLWFQADELTCWDDSMEHWVYE